MTQPTVRAGILTWLVENNERRFGEPYLPMECAQEMNVRLIDVYEALWGLLGDGLIYLNPAGQGSGTDNWRWSLTDAGDRAATGRWEPRDHHGFIARLHERAPGLEDDAMTYIDEAITAFNARCYLASSVMLGVAAEQVFERVAAAFVAARPVETAKLQRLLDGTANQQARFVEFRKRLEPLRAELPEPLRDTLTLDAVADLLRVTRNAAGHPTGQRIDEETAYTHLVMAATLLAKMTEMAEHFEQAAG